PLRRAVHRLRAGNRQTDRCAIGNAGVVRGVVTRRSRSVWVKREGQEYRSAAWRYVRDGSSASVTQCGLLRLVLQERRYSGPSVIHTSCQEPHTRCKTHPYSITSSAATSRPGGTVRPSAFAVLRLSTVSYLVGVCTGKSAGLAPRRMRST